MDQVWFEMADVRKRLLDNSVWIPLRASREVESTGERGHAGYRREFLGVGSVAFPTNRKVQAETLGWTDVGLIYNHRSVVENGRYRPADIFENDDAGLLGVPLVLSQEGNREERREWHLHQDLVIALALKREGDFWLRIDEGYIVVARLTRSEDGSPCLMEFRAEHLKDYLCARDMALYASSYRSREEVFKDVSHVDWPDDESTDLTGGDRWVGRIVEIHEGGEPYGSTTAVIRIGRRNVDVTAEVPRIGVSDETTSSSWTLASEGAKLFSVQGELWRNEWVNPAAHSPRVRRDELFPTVYFVTDAAGARESSETLAAAGRWLWFQPDIMMRLAHHRGGGLEWYTRDTGRIRGSPDAGVVFGVNVLGLVNVYAKDIAFLPEWQQRIWAGFNVGPDGGVSAELLADQAEGTPAETRAPEHFLPKAIDRLNLVAREKLGFKLFRDHEKTAMILSHSHRFRSLNQLGLFSLAKDVARLISDSIDESRLKQLVPPPKEDNKRGSLKALEKVLARDFGEQRARGLLAPLFGIYELRLADAHLPQKDLSESLAKVGIDSTAPFVIQGCQLLHSCVDTLFQVARDLGQTSGPVRS